MTRLCLPTGTTLVLAIALNYGVCISTASAVGRLLTIESDPDRLESRCYLQSISGKFSGNVSQYESKGECETWFIPGGPGKTELRDRIRWEATGKYASTTDADESISLLRLVRPDQPNYYVVGKVTAKMTCKQDPWLNPDRFGCNDLFYGRSESLNQYNLENLYAKDRNVPRTSILTNEQRAALQQQYQQWRQQIASAAHQTLAGTQKGAGSTLQNKALSQPDPILTGIVRDALAKQFPKLFPMIGYVADKSGKVTLTNNGIMPSWQDVYAVGDFVKRIKGVTSVDNKLYAVVNPTPPQNQGPFTVDGANKKR